MADSTPVAHYGSRMPRQTPAASSPPDGRAIGALAAVTRKMNRGVALERIMDHIYDSFRTIIAYDRMGLALLSDDRQSAVSRWNRTSAAQTILDAGYAAPLRGSSLEPLLNNNTPRIINDLEAYLFEHPDSRSTQKILHEGICSNLTYPLWAGKNPIGFLFFSSREKNTYRDIHLALFQEIAAQVALMIEKSRLIDQDRLKTELLGMASHDLKNAIVAIKLAVATLKADLSRGPTSPMQQHLQHIEGGCSWMFRLVHDLLDTSALQAGTFVLHKHTVHFPAYLKGFFAANAVLAERKVIRLVHDLDDALPDVAIDPDRMDQVLSNLLINAVNFSLPGTTITVAVRHAAGGIRVSVQDQGCGMSARQLKTLFTPFQHHLSPYSAVTSGSGLGLFIAKTIVEAHGGTIDARSRPRHGATFSFTLPAVPC